MPSCPRGDERGHNEVSVLRCLCRWLQNNHSLGVAARPAQSCQEHAHTHKFVTNSCLAKNAPFFTVCSSWQMISVFLPPTVPLPLCLTQTKLFSPSFGPYVQASGGGIVWFCKTTYCSAWQSCNAQDIVVFQRHAARDMEVKTNSAFQLRNKQGQAVLRFPPLHTAVLTCQFVAVHEQCVFRVQRKQCGWAVLVAPFLHLHLFLWGKALHGYRNQKMHHSNEGNDCDWSQYVKIKQKNINHYFVYYIRVSIKMCSHTRLWCSRSRYQTSW